MSMSLNSDVHAVFISDHQRKFSSKHARRSIEFWATEPIFLSGLYWGLNAAAILKHNDAIDVSWATERTLSCRCQNGGFGGNVGHDAHILYTLSGIQCLALCGSTRQDVPNVAGLIEFIVSLQQSEGGFASDEFGEDDIRHTYAAVASLHLLGSLDRIDTALTINHIVHCQTIDGAFATRPGGESHAGYTFCCVATLAMCNGLEHIKYMDRLISWLSKRQFANGGVNGRPSKRADICYAWWVGASLSILSKLDTIDKEQLAKTILQHQCHDGGLAAHLGDKPDIFHTMFGVAALSLLGDNGGYNIQDLNPFVCLPQSIYSNFTASH